MSSNDDTTQKFDMVRWFEEEGPGEEHSKLLAIAKDELTKTHQAIEQHPMLKERGKPGKKRTLAPEFEDFPRNNGEDWEHYLDRVEAEGERRGEHLIQPWIDTDTTYWELDITNLVYVEGCGIGRMVEEGIVMARPLDFTPRSKIAEVIQGLRLLRTPFNGAE